MLLCNPFIKLYRYFFVYNSKWHAFLVLLFSLFKCHYTIPLSTGTKSIVTISETLNTDLLKCSALDIYNEDLY